MTARQLLAPYPNGKLSPILSNPKQSMKQQYQVLSVIVLLILASFSALAQRTVTGRIVDNAGTSMPGVNVIVKGTSAGTTSDAEGNYSIAVPNDAAILVYSFIGYASQESPVGTRTSIDITLQEDVAQLSEVVVTALGIERSTKALQYSVSEVNGDNFTKARELNLGAQLAGRVAGVNVTKPATGPAGSTRIIIRGNKSLGGQNQPLYVIDGVPMDNSNFGSAGIWGGRDQGDGLSSMNPDDIESITVLKGANASALYGSRGGNGVINITTKRGKMGKSLGIDFNTNYVAESFIDVRDVQKKYGTGNYVDTNGDDIANGVATKPDSKIRGFQWSDDSWGPAFDGSPVIQFDGVTRPYSYAGDNWKRFYNTGQTWTNSLAISGGSEKQTFRLSVADLRNKSILPNSGFDRTNVTLSANGKYGDKLTVNARVMYSHEKAKNRPNVSDSPGNAPQALWHIPGNINVLDMKGDPNKLGALPEGVDPELLKIYAQGADQDKFAGQEFLPTDNNWGQNPYWSTYQLRADDTRDRVNSSVQLKYDITPWLYASGRASVDWYTRKALDLGAEGTGYDLVGGMSQADVVNTETNFEGLLGFNKTFGKFNVNAFVGGNRMRRSYEYIQGQGTGFNVQFFPSLNNTKSRTYNYDYNQSGINSLFASAEISYNEFLYLTATARTDYFSVLNPGNNSVTYPSIGAGFVFSDAFSGLPSWMSFGKVRASWAQSGIVNISPYSSNLTYSLYGFNHLGYSLGSFSQNMGTGGTIPNPTLTPALSTEIEAGLDMRFFNNRVGFDFTYYHQKTTDDIIGQSISMASGFGATNINVGELQNQGFELMITGTPVRGDLTWDVSFNIAQNRNKVIQILPGTTEYVPDGYSAEPRTRNALIKQIVGYPFSEITGRTQALDPQGRPVFSEGGSPIATNDFVPLGNAIAKATGGLNNTFNYKGINLSFLIDFRIGGKIFSGSNNRLTQWGLSEQSLQGREGEKPLHIEGVTRTGAGTDEDPYVYTEVNRDLTPHEASNYWNSVGGETTGITSMWIYDGSYGKLRQLTLGYSLPAKLLAKTPFKSVNVSFVGRNLAILWKNIPNVDPESAYSNQAGAQGLEYFALPTTRSYGFNIGIGF
jgi:TonB-linked SusC/RagA family outer membrane protein